MSKSSKGSRFWVILWWILYTLLIFFFGFSSGVVSQVKAVEDSEEIANRRIDAFHFVIFEKSFRSSDRFLREFEDRLEVIKEQMLPEHFEGADLYRFYISQIHEQYYPDVDPYIALAVLEIESNYKPNLMSSAGAVGLMQWIPKWHAWRMEKFHLNDMWDPYTNIIVGMDYLNDLYLSTGSWREALYGYNHSSAYVTAVLDKADSLRGGGYFG